MNMSRLGWLLVGVGLTWACNSSSASGGDDGAAGGSILGAAGAPSTVGAGGRAFVVEGTPWVEEGTAGTGLVSSVFGDPLSFGSAGVEPIECSHPNPGTCDWTRFDAGCCSTFACVNAAASPYDDSQIQMCQGIVDCLKANPTCPTAADPFCSARNGDSVSACTTEYEFAGFQGTDQEDRLALQQHMLDTVACVCGI